MSDKNTETIIDIMKDKKYLQNLEIQPEDIIKAVKLAKEEFEELQDIVNAFNYNNENLKDLCKILKGHNEYFDAVYPDHNYFDLNYKSILVTVIQPINENKKEEAMQLYKDEVYIYPDNISPVNVDEIFTLNFNENIDFEKITERFNNEVEEEELEEGV